MSVQTESYTFDMYLKPRQGCGNEGVLYTYSIFIRLNNKFSYNGGSTISFPLGFTSLRQKNISHCWNVKATRL